MAVLPQLVDSDGYRPCDWDLKRDRFGLAYWVALFCEHLDLTLELIAEEYPGTASARVDALRGDYLATMRAVEQHPECHPRIDVLLLTELRRQVLVRHGFPDPFAGVKRRENEAALAMLPGVFAEAFECDPAARLEKLIVGLMAGNVFDLGAMPTIDRYRSRSHGFVEARASQPPRPWLIDDLDAWQNRWRTGPRYRHALFFVDNAGSDICLGCLPLARWMLEKGTRVTLAANTAPALNDVLAVELRNTLQLVSRLDDTIRGALADRRLGVVESGSRVPLLDLTALSQDCAAAARDADLILLHGMGRAIESNFSARLRCDAVRTAVLKDPAVAQHVGGQLFDCVFRFTPGESG